MTLHPIETRSLTELFVSQIEDKIFSGELPPGHRMPPERELAKELGISQTIVNNGFSILAGRGLLRIVPRKGTFVTDYNQEGGLETLSALVNYTQNHMPDKIIKDMYQFRLMVEREYFSSAVVRMTPEEKEEFVLYIDRVKKNACDGELFAQSMYEAIRYLGTKSGSTIYQMINNGFKPVYLSVFQTLYKIVDMQIYLRNVDRIGQEILAGDIAGIPDSLREFQAYELSVLEAHNCFS